MPTHLQVHDVLLCCKQLLADAESHVCVCASLNKLFRSWTAEAGFVPFVVQNGWFARIAKARLQGLQKVRKKAAKISAGMCTCQAMHS